jgi:hypothetical protein
MKKSIVGICLVMLVCMLGFHVAATRHYSGDSTVPPQYIGDISAVLPVVRGGWTCSAADLNVNKIIINICTSVSCSTDQDCLNWGTQQYCKKCDITKKFCEDPTLTPFP